MCLLHLLPANLLRVCMCVCAGFLCVFVHNQPLCAASHRPSHPSLFLHSAGMCCRWCLVLQEHVRASMLGSFHIHNTAVLYVKNLAFCVPDRQQSPTRPLAGWRAVYPEPLAVHIIGIGALLTTALATSVPKLIYCTQTRNTVVLTISVSLHVT
jgi:hypothetical protein